MNTVKESVGGKHQKTPYGKLIGIVESPDLFRAVTESLKQLGVRDIDLLDGASGVETLEIDKKAVSHFFFGDMEEVMMRRYLAAVKHGHSVFAAVVEPKSVEQAAARVKALGATEIIHFGEWVITNY